MRRWHHPHAVSVYDFVETDELLAIVMEYVPGGNTLEDYMIEWGGPLPYDDIRRVFDAVLDAMAQAHGHNIVHRDLKCQNILLNTTDGVLIPKVVDFGIAKAFGVEQREGPPLTATGQMIGTPQYMSPEQVRGSKDIDGRADLYAVGTLMAEMISGSKLVVANTDIEVFMVHIDNAPHEVPPRVRDSIVGHIITRAVAKKAADRYPTATAMLADLEAALPPDLGPRSLPAPGVRAAVGPPSRLLPLFFRGQRAATVQRD